METHLRVGYKAVFMAASDVHVSALKPGFDTSDEESDGS